MKTNKSQEEPKEMVGGCCVCSDENGWTENPLVYCDGQGCNVAVHQACYGIVSVPTGSWYCRKCELSDKATKVRCELCPSRSGALKRTNCGGWAHVVCALYIPEIRFGNVTTMEPIMLEHIPQERFNKTCYICEEKGKISKSSIGACMQCNKMGCKQNFHVICAQAMGLLCEEAGNYMDNVKYCGYCQYHYSKIRKGAHVKAIPPYRPTAFCDSSEEDNTDGREQRAKRKLRQIAEVNKCIGKDDKMDDSPLIISSEPSEIGKFKPIEGTSSIIKVEFEQKPGSPVVSLVTTANTKTSGSPVCTSISSLPATLTVTSTVSTVSRPPCSTAPSSTNRTPLLTTVSLPLNSSTSVPHPSSLLTLASTSSRSKGETTVVSSHIGLLTTVADAHRKSKRIQKTPSRDGSPQSDIKDTPLVICEDKKEENSQEDKMNTSPDDKTQISSAVNKSDTVSSCASDRATPSKRQRSNSQDRGRRSKRTAAAKRGRVQSNYKDKDCDSEDSSPEPYSSEIIPNKRTRKKNDPKEMVNTFITNGVTTNSLLLGNQINPSSAVAQKMTDTLNDEIAAHSIYKEEEKPLNSLIGPALPGKKDITSSTSVLGNSQPPPLPQSLEQLLERQWEQGSQFLMEQAQHFDIASLLSCLHQLRQENARLEETVSNLIARRDHLLAVNARLSVPLTSNNHSYPTHSTVTSTAHSTAHPSAIVNSAILTSRSHSQSRHPSGGTTSSHVVRGTTSPHGRMTQHPIENGLPEAEIRYRQNEFQHRQQQSPMMPPGVQPSPNSIRQSPASSYHSSSSPHTGVPSLSPSGPPSHSLHPHPSIMVSTHHTMNRGPEPRAELVRLTPGQTPHSATYPVYQMVSPPVAPAHHSPGISQHVMRREADSNRGHSSQEKR